MNKMHEEGIVFQSEQQMGEFLRLLMDAFNNTRTKENRGNKPWELSERGMIGGMPAMVPEMSQPAPVTAKRWRRFIRMIRVLADLGRNIRSVVEEINTQR